MHKQRASHTTPDNVGLVLRESQAVLARHGRTFNLAGKLLPRAHRENAAVVYAFCRLADDLVDEATDIDTAHRDVALLSAELDGTSPPRPLVAAFLHVCEMQHINPQAANYLLKGMLSDLEPVALQTDAELIQYSYCAAGTVGLMMSGVIGVRAAEATPHAIDLGIGMQITNICRDVLEDAQRGRVYLPKERLEQVGIYAEELLRGECDRKAVRQVVVDLLHLAERYYESADAGMKYIPWRARTAILCASRMYRAIGQRIIQHDIDVLDGRTWVPFGAKLGWLLYGVLKSPFIAAAPHRSQLHQPIRHMPGAAA